MSEHTPEQPTQPEAPAAPPAAPEPTAPPPPPPAAPRPPPPPTPMHSAFGQGRRSSSRVAVAAVAARLGSGADLPCSRSIRVVPASALDGPPAPTASGTAAIAWPRTGRCSAGSSTGPAAGGPRAAPAAAAARCRLLAYSSAPIISEVVRTSRIEVRSAWLVWPSAQSWSSRPKIATGTEPMISSSSIRRRWRASSVPSLPGATRHSTKAHRSRWKYATTAESVPKCSRISKESRGCS
jgi:hypothetical protein